MEDKLAEDRVNIVALKDGGKFHIQGGLVRRVQRTLEEMKGGFLSLVAHCT